MSATHQAQSRDGPERGERVVLEGQGRWAQYRYRELGPKTIRPRPHPSAKRRCVKPKGSPGRRGSACGFWSRAATGITDG